MSVSKIEDEQPKLLSKLDKWSKSTELVLTLSALLFFAAYAFQVITRSDGFLGVVSEMVIWGTWIVFLIDYIVRLSITDNRWKWFYRHIPDLLIVALPMLRPLRLMRFLTVISLIQRGAGSILRGKVVIYTIGASFLIISIAALAILDAEQGKGSIDTIGDALWWAFVTMTTVGYGDFYPVTTTGRIIAAALMIGGIALIGAVTATLASWIVEKVSENSSNESLQIQEMKNEISEIKEILIENKKSCDC